MRVHHLIVAGALCACTRPATAPRPAGEPAPPPAAWLGLLGEYDTPAGMRVVLENNGVLTIADTNRHSTALTERSTNVFAVDATAAQQLLGARGDAVRFERDNAG